MKILRSYILKELIISFILSLLIFTFVLFIGNIVKLAELVITKGIAVGYVGRLFLYLLPYLLNYTIPMAVLTGTLLAFGRLCSDNEITALKAIGFNLSGIFVPAITLGLILSLFSVMLNDQIIPRAHFATRKLLAEIGTKKPTACLEEGTFIKTFKGYIIFIHKITGNKLKNIRIYQPQKGRPTRTITAESGEFIPMSEKNIVALKLINGSSDETNLKNPDNLYKLNFKTYYLTLDLASQLEKKDIQKKPKDMTIHELLDEIKKLSRSRINTAPLVKEIHKKISLSFASFVFILIGIPLALLAGRGEKSIGFGLSLGVIVVYYLLLMTAEALAMKTNFNPALCMWFPDILIGVTGIALFCLAVEK
ncbi:MAG: LptF/LptG family permease [Candidatus Omnitrophota bacterium]|nr:LptF/LptG family permease [Candidatus Omnitrophota bacterium]